MLISSLHTDLPKEAGSIRHVLGAPEGGAAQQLPAKLQQGITLTGLDVNFGGAHVDSAEACSGAASDAQRLFDFWSEEDNKRFISAIDSFQYPPDIKAVAERMGNTSVEKTSSYAALYIEALNHYRTVSQSQGKPTDFHITASDVYSYHGVGPLYAEHVRKKAATKPTAPLNSASSTASSASTELNGGGCKTSRSEPGGGGGMSIDFLCGGSTSEPNPPKASSQQASPTTVLNPAVLQQHLQRSNSPPSALSTETSTLIPADFSFSTVLHRNLGHFFIDPRAQQALARTGLEQFIQQGQLAPQQQASCPQAPTHKEVLHASSDGHAASAGGDNVAVQNELTKAGGSGPVARAAKRKHDVVEEKSMEEVEAEIEKMRVQHSDVWKFSSMKVVEKPFEDPSSKNPWEWSRKVIAKTNGGYSQWMPLFAEHILLSKREVSDDMRTIRIKAPPPPPQQSEDSNPYKKNSNAAGDKKAARGAPVQRKGVDASWKLQRVSKNGDDEVAPPKSKGGGRWPNGAGAGKGGEEEGKGGGGVDKKKSSWRFVPVVGDSVEVKWEGEWWEATVKKVKMPQDRMKQSVFVSYVGGTEDENEWIPLNRVRVPKTGTKNDSSPAKAKAKGPGRWPNGKGAKKTG